MRRLDMSILPFVIAFILGFRLEDSARRAFEATGADPWFLFSSPVSIALITLSVLIVIAAFVFPILNSRRSPR
jgi:putative tricarboxylic transport membrane protein